MTNRKSKEKFARGVEMAAAKMAKTVPVEKPISLSKFGSSSVEQVDAILKQMTLEEKATMLGGIDSMGIRGNSRLGLPTVWCSDASSGIRCFGPGTAFPALVGLTATWDRQVIKKIGTAIAEECKAIGISVLLGPGVNIARVPTCGRNFEYMGEDPFLTSEMVVPYIVGVQERGVAATVKHFACNNSDYDRHRMDAVVDERTLREIYLPAFKAAVKKAGVKCLMNSYNPVNGKYASENEILLTEILKGEWGFEGFVMSDWSSVYSTIGPLLAGLDLEMPRGIFMNPQSVVEAVNSGDVSEEVITDKVKRMLKVFIDLGIYERENIDTNISVGGQYAELGADVACQCPVLLKNSDGILPLHPTSIKKIVVLGENAMTTPTGGGGSSYVHVSDPSNVYRALNESLDTLCEVDYFADLGGKLARSAVTEADAVVIAVGYGHVLESEGYDRSWELPEKQDVLIRAASQLNPNTIVIIFAGGGVETDSWASSAKAIIHAFYLGAFGGTAVTDIMLGKANPSGKLPFTMAKHWNDHQSTASYVKTPAYTNAKLVEGPKVRRSASKAPVEKLIKAKREDWKVPYREGIYIGYRHFDTNSIEPAFPFGHGLSYTSFDLSDVEVSSETIGAEDSVTISFTLKNTGEREGSEVVQVYVSDPESALPRPEKELKGFDKYMAAPGEEIRGEIELNQDAFSYFKPEEHAWVAEPGSFIISVGMSSRDIRWSRSVVLSE